MSMIAGPLPSRLKLMHGFGAVAFGVKDGGFSFFLLPFYNLVLGVDAGIVGAALATALVIDAIADPLIGHLSDRTYTRWGRRLPWLYLAPIPLAIAWAVLWSPPFTGVPTYGEILMLAVGVRLLLSACEVPSISLVPEITGDYVERTTLFRYRFLSGWVGGLTMSVLAFTVFLPTPESQLQPDGYAVFGLVGAVVIIVSVTGSALGQHRYVARLPDQAPPPFSLRLAFADIIDAFRERAFVIFAFGALAAYISQGVTLSITLYVIRYVWQFSEFAFKLYPAVLGLSVIIMFVIVGPLHRRFGKPASGAGGSLATLAIAGTPYVLFLTGLWPQTGSALSTGLFMGFMVAANTAGVVAIISATSMVAEIVEAFEERTGKRAEGTFYAGNWLVQKSATGGGILLTSLIVESIGLAPGTAQDAVGADVVENLALAYLAVSAVLAITAAYWLARFPISQADHEARLIARTATAHAAQETPAPHK
ncbi:MFS transporter [Erythrobacter sp. R86502]|uniref:MFS transporter n=1 Tax=Erythrobacter sp. R86502 TaxID=3093846 RepID=UPI0036D41AC6